MNPKREISEEIEIEEVEATVDLDWLFDKKGKIDNAHEDNAFGISPEIFEQRDIADDFENLVDSAEG